MGMMTSENQAVKSNALQHKRKGELPSAQGPFRRLIWGRYVTSQALEERQIAFGESFAEEQRENAGSRQVGAKGNRNMASLWRVLIISTSAGASIGNCA